MRKLTILAAAGVGYVLGARAGRERYEQLRQTFEQVKNDPRVQEKAHQAAETVREHAPQVAEAVKEKAGQAVGAASSAASSAAGAAKEKASGVPVSPSGSPSGSPVSEADADGRLNPERLRLDEQTGPQGDLP